MQDQNSPVGAKALRQAEAEYRKQVSNEPTDTRARLRLAWCVFLLSLHQAGRESVMAELLVEGDEAAAGVVQRIGAALDPDARRLLRDCLRQLCTVTHFSTHGPDHQEVAQLQELVCLAGGEQEALGVEAETVGALADLARELQSRSTPARRPRRRPTASGGEAS